MRFKYYLRGIGIGITLATLLLTVSFYFGKDYLYNESLTEEEIIEKAAALGMVMPEVEGAKEDIAEEDSIQENTIEENEVPKGNIEEVENNIEDTQITAEKEDEISAESSMDEDEVITYIPFTVRAGESSEVICSHLKKAGLIDDSEEFNKYLHKCKVDNLIQNGTFYVKQGSAYDDLVAILVNKDIRTTTPPKK